MLLVLLLACATAQAAHWVRLSAKNLFPYYVDVSSITVDGDARSAWFKTTYPHHARKSDDGTKYLATTIEMTQILCTGKQVRALSWVWSFEDGSGGSGSNPTAFQPVPPDSWAELAMDYLCKWTPKPTG